jgi:hypothetical protein
MLTRLRYTLNPPRIGGKGPWELAPSWETECCASLVTTGSGGCRLAKWRAWGSQGSRSGVLTRWFRSVALAILAVGASVTTSSALIERGTPAPTLALARFARDDWPVAEPEWAQPGPYRWPIHEDFTLASFGADQRLVGTYFFYWFMADVYRQRVLERGSDPYIYHPTDVETMSFLEPDWYEKQFLDMQAAGIDFVLPDYWGEPGQYDRRVAPAPELNYFSTQGLPPMVEALDRLAARGQPLKVALFLDTTIMNDADLTTRQGKDAFYFSIRDYFSKIPPRHWAAIGGRPIVWLYDAQRVSAFNQSTFDDVYRRFPLDFGGLSPYIVREWQWRFSKNVEPPEPVWTEGLYGWGAAPSGFNPDPSLTVAAVGPGFSNVQLGGGAGRLFTDRQGGGYYEDNLKRAVTSGRQIMVVETWNELGEASGILETFEFGRQYIDLTRKYADVFKSGS